MNVIVNIPEWQYNAIKENKNDIGTAINVVCAVKNGTPIPDNSTNLDVMRIMFKLVEMKHWGYKDSRCFFVDPDFPGNQNDICVTHEWCGATYKGCNNEIELQESEDKE